MESVVHLSPSCGLRGKQISSADVGDKGARDVYEFLGIPYAEPPTGNLRFSDPRPMPLWNGIKDAAHFGAVCPQNVALLNAMLPFPVAKPELMSEDCLFLNVWTPSVDSAAQLPVMLLIHGGGFNSGFSNIYSGKTLASTKDVALVTINHRVGPLGFLCTNDSAATGNYGILDQIEALKWVQQHIANFGGDPNNVTIFGQSSGGMSVSLLVLSPLAKGLFRRAIAHSGNVFGGDIIACPPEKAARNLTAGLVKTFPDGPPATATGAEIVDFLRQQPIEDLVKISDECFAVIDGRVLPSAPTDIYSSAAHNHVELMVGCNSDEGQVILLLLTSKFGMSCDSLNVGIARRIIGKFMMEFFSLSNADQVIQAVVGQYCGGLDSTASSEDVHKVLVEFLGDVLFLIPTIKTADHHSRTSKTFLYYFNHRPAFAWFPHWMNADHGAEMFFIMDFPSLNVQLSADDERLSQQMISYWVNFAKNGNPNEDGLAVWPEYNESTKEYMALQLPVKADSKLKAHRADFWLRQLPQLVKAAATEQG